MIIQKTLAIADAEPGMRLAIAVKDDSGHLLLPAAAILTDHVIQSLRRRGVAQLLVEHEERGDPALMAAHQAEIERQLARLFRKAGEGAETKVLQQTILAFRLKRRT